MEKWLARCLGRDGVAKGRALHADHLRRDRGSADLERHMFRKE